MAYNIGIQMKRKEQTKLFTMISNWKKLFGLNVLFIGGLHISTFHRRYTCLAFKRLLTCVGVNVGLPFIRKFPPWEDDRQQHEQCQHTICVGNNIINVCLTQKCEHSNICVENNVTVLKTVMLKHHLSGQ